MMRLDGGVAANIPIRLRGKWFEIANLWRILLGQEAFLFMRRTARIS
uniref:Uncharacterized protein n=1 Tax=Anguilla anguilla TaxID=7936 RepID=A0A0E9SHV2_ANGAN